VQDQQGVQLRSRSRGSSCFGNDVDDGMGMMIHPGECNMSQGVAPDEYPSEGSLQWSGRFAKAVL
jgi:hypothetical protein